MTRADFTVLVNTIKGTLDRSAELYQKYKIDLIEYEEDYNHIISLLGQSSFGAAGWDWVEYFIYEDNHEVWDTDKNQIPFSTVDEVYDFLIKEGYVKEVLNSAESLDNDKQ